eukprot:1003155-Prymnesium_polylepis.2
MPPPPCDKKARRISAVFEFLMGAMEESERSPVRADSRHQTCRFHHPESGGAGSWTTGKAIPLSHRWSRFESGRVLTSCRQSPRKSATGSMQRRGRSASQFSEALDSGSVERETHSGASIESIDPAALSQANARSFH